MPRSIVPGAVILSLLMPAVALRATEPRMVPETFTGLELRGIGPALMSGRIADIAVHPQRQSTWYVAVGSGGVWKTENSGTTWTPVFDGESSYSIGCVTIDPSRPSTLWVGTGENVGGRHVGFGDGVYRSLDGGASWENMGLAGTEHIGTIVVDPRDSSVVFVAAQGPLWSKGGERGLYRSRDGGKSWQLVLSAGPYTGVNEVVMDPRDSRVLLAATHQRFRTVAALVDGGPESGIHKSTDGGQTWREITAGLPEEDMGRIGLAISPQNPDVVYATIELAHREGGFYRSADGGETWEKRSDYLSGGTGPHYYQEIFACPHRFDRVYQMDVRLHVTEDGGLTFNPVGEEHKHGDNHALAFDLSDPDYLLNGSDGGVYESWDRGKTWKFIANLPVTQFYKVAVDNDLPFYNIYGGTQDNNTQGGPSRTDNVQGIRNSDWFITLFADGHQPAVDPENPDIVYSEWQQGNLVRYDRKTGEIVYIQPQPEPDEPAERWNWDAPVLISPHSPSRLYYASQRVWRSDDRGDSWTPVSGDLSRGEDRLLLPMMGRVQSFDAVWDLWAMSKFATITSLAESPLQEGLLYAGTDDGLLQVSENGGETWRRIDRLPGVPPRAFVNDIKADLFDADTLYVALDDHKTGSFSPYLLKSTDRGRSWTSMVGDLPDRHLVWRIVQDHEQQDLFFLGTELGIFFTVDGGRHWIELQGGVPTIPFRDLAIQRRENDVVGATFGRGFFVFDDYSPLRHVSEETLAQEALLFPVKDTYWYIPRRPLGRGEKGSQGAAFFTAPNPPFGAVFTYYLRDRLATRKEARLEAEKGLLEAAKDTPYPGWDELRREAHEDEPTVVLTVRNDAGDVVRTLQGPREAGFHRVAWDLRFPNRETPADDDWSEDGLEGFLSLPGTYTVTLSKRVEGRLTELAGPRSFEVAPLRQGTLPGAEPEDTVAFLQEVEELRRAITGADAALKEALAQIDAIEEALERATLPDSTLEDRVTALEKELLLLNEGMNGDQQKRSIGEPRARSIKDRLSVAVTGNRYSTYGPTPTHRRSVEIARETFDPWRRELSSIVDERIPALEEELEAAGVPWTPGRAVPSAREVP